MLLLQTIKLLKLYRSFSAVSVKCDVNKKNGRDKKHKRTRKTLIKAKDSPQAATSLSSLQTIQWWPHLTVFTKIVFERPTLRPAIVTWLWLNTGSQLRAYRSQWFMVISFTLKCFNVNCCCISLNHVVRLEVPAILGHYTVRPWKPQKLFDASSHRPFRNTLLPILPCKV